MIKLNYPIRLTEYPHQGKPLTWVLESEKHLNEIINSLNRTNYFDWCYENGCHCYALDSYLDWLKNDLRFLTYEELKEESK